MIDSPLATSFLVSRYLCTLCFFEMLCFGESLLYETFQPYALDDETKIIDTLESKSPHLKAIYHWMMTSVLTEVSGTDIKNNRSGVKWEAGEVLVVLQDGLSVDSTHPELVKLWPTVLFAGLSSASIIVSEIRLSPLGYLELFSGLASSSFLKDYTVMNLNDSGDWNVMAFCELCVGLSEEFQLSRRQNLICPDVSVVIDTGDILFSIKSQIWDSCMGQMAPFHLAQYYIIPFENRQLDG
ncbi:hypothetical protein Tco_0665067 [Tanacetum coccineum]